MKMIKKLEYWWRHSVVYPVLRRIFRNNERKVPIDIQSIKSILILRYDRIGDMIVTTPIFKGLKDAHPHLRIGVLASQTNAEVIRHNPYVDQIHILPKHWWQFGWEIIKARREHYDVVLNLIFNRTTSGGILSNLIAPKGIKVGQGGIKYRFYFNKLIALERNNQHIVRIHTSYLEQAIGVNIFSSSSNYEIFIDSKTHTRISLFLESNQLKPRQMQRSDYLPYIVFNLSASNRWTRFSLKQVEELGMFLKCLTAFRTIILTDPGDYEMHKAARALCVRENCLSFPELGKATLLEIAALIEGAQFVISPDTSIVHFASAMCTPVLGFYTSTKDNHEWLPYKIKYRIVISENHCPTSSIPVHNMITAIQEFISTLQSQKEI
jgi:ADP-heptose:LPS heptosyltransferase